MPSPDKIRVLIVDDIQEARENIRRMLTFEPSVEVVGAAKNGREAIDLAVELQPDVVIMDINMPDMDGITATEEIRKKIPHIQIVILSVQSDPSYMRRAMLAGARDYLTKPPMIEELAAAVKRAGAVAATEKVRTMAAYPTASPDVSKPRLNFPVQNGKIITVYSPKGGTGCSMIAANLALALQSSSTPTALIDCNLQFGDVAVLLNEQGRNNLIDLTSRVDELDPEIVQSVMVEHVQSGMDLLACPPRPEMAEMVTGEQFSKLIQYLTNMYTYVVIDTASYLTETVQAALEYADSIILVTTQEIPSIKSCNLFLSLADQSGIREKILFIMNRYDKRITITPEKVGESLRQPIVSTIPFEEKTVINSINRGVPFISENQTYPVSKSILDLAALVQKKAPENELAGVKGLNGKK
jgi:pilus assembly protein CpaE